MKKALHFLRYSVVLFIIGTFFVGTTLYIYEKFGVNRDTIGQLRYLGAIILVFLIDQNKIQFTRFGFQGSGEQLSKKFTGRALAVAFVLIVIPIVYTLISQTIVALGG
ncbi:hypothetical protein [Halalkalibacillus halophilus]|uniref:hypothetical protein n=1 Tax=Halalkalibacillus halophilus TaxID=392827 RepID=UPI0004041AE2|nr:hypothetical protein [Halalkalibacillus halophilus]